MKRKIIFLVTISLFLTMFVSCYYDNEEALYPSVNTTCDTTNVTFSVTIVSVLNNNCYSCHSNATATSSGVNIRLENYADVVAKSVNIIGAVKHIGSFSPMPKNGGKLKACSINQLDIWIRNGMLNN